MTNTELIKESEELIERLLKLPVGIGTFKTVGDVIKDIGQLKRRIADFKKATTVTPQYFRQAANKVIENKNRKSK